jgi:aldehyde:ferredoxin oxidoreductase
MKGRGMAPTYMAIGALGLNLGITNLSTIGMANILCSEMGLDPIATGGTLSTAMEMVERGYLTSEELKLELGFGREEQVIQAIQRMSTQKGHAKRIGQGGWALCQKYGHKDLFMGVKKIPMAPFDPRAIQGMGLHFATSSLGPHHIYAYTFIDEILHVHDHDSDPGEVVGKPELVKEYQDVTAVMDCLGLCNWPFLVLKLKNFVPLVNSCLGTNYTREDLLTFGERTWNIERLFNLQAGTKREDDTLPQRFFDQSLKNATAQRQISRLQEMIQPYYTLRGWDDQGRPTEEMLHRLSLTGEPYA